ncbi:hypothetical protein FQN57_003441 [Myotisia sp. PD_48]|nr:hypothetical protein FQN57_003441 [Myotisia sp. PD_48]
MPWKLLRSSGATNNESDGTTVVYPEKPARRSEHTPRPTHPAALSLPRLSESVARSTTSPEIIGASSQHLSNDGNNNTKSGYLDPMLSQQNKKRHRFSLLKFRHASDPQLSTSYQQSQVEPPPVPALPPTPTIITTSPTTSNLEQATRRAHESKPSSLRHVNKDPLPSKPNSHEKKPDSVFAEVSGSSSPPAPSTGKSSHVSFEQPGRLSTTSLRNGGQQAGLFPGTRLSESSRSDASSGEHSSFQSQSKKEPVSSFSSFLKFPRAKKSHGSLFPLPVKIPPPENQSHSHGNPTPIPSPSHSFIGRPRSNAGSPGPPMNRKNSTASARSKSSLMNRPSRSPTVGSLPEIKNAPQSSLELAPSRTTAFSPARKSFGDLFNMSGRLKHNEHSGSPNGSPRSTGSRTPPHPASKQNSISLARTSPPAREEGDTSATYLARLEEHVHRGTIATILSRAGDEFHSVALRKYIRGFSFFGDPMDMAIRKLLMEAELPKETQHIDRFIQAFANRYHECNPGIFSSTGRSFLFLIMSNILLVLIHLLEQAYFVAFSLLILHTDVFNKNNKRKMQRSDYVKNTRGEGVYDEILECFYDNICYTPFIQVEDEVNLGPRALSAKTRSPLSKITSSDHVGRSSRDPIDPYALILEGKLDSLRPNLKDVMELEDVYSSIGTGPRVDVKYLNLCFDRPCILQIVSARSRPDAFVSQASIANPAVAQPGLVDIRVARVGLLWRKDPKKKKARSPWQEWGAILTSSQLYFFRDIQWVKSLISQHESRQKHGRRHSVVFKPPVTDFKPDLIVPTSQAVSLLDSTYKKHKNSFLLVRHGGFEEVFLANSETERNDWMAFINHSAAYQSTNIQMKGLNSKDEEALSTHRTIRPLSTSSEVSEYHDAKSAIRKNANPQLSEEATAERCKQITQRIKESNEKLFVSQRQIDDLLRNARHLQRLTPVHPRTRDQVILSAGRISAKVKWARFDIWRTKCHRAILAHDLSEEQRTNPLSDKEPVRASFDGTSQLFESFEFASDTAPSLPPLSNGNLTIAETQSQDPSLRRDSTKNSITPSDMQSQSAGSTSGIRDDHGHPSKGTRDTSFRRSSVLSSQGDLESNLTTPTASIADGDEQRFLRESGIVSADSSEAPKPPERSNSTKKTEETSESPLGDARSKVRRSLHRTLRDAHHLPHRHRSRKAGDSGNTNSTTDDGESGGLARTSNRFTVHGKKASIVTFGSEWQAMSTEQRLKQRKLQSEDSRASDLGSVDDRTESIVSGSLPDVQDQPDRPDRPDSVATATSIHNPEKIEIPNSPTRIGVEAPNKTEPSKSTSEPSDALNDPQPSLLKDESTTPVTSDKNSHHDVHKSPSPPPAEPILQPTASLSEKKPILTTAEQVY